MLQAGVSDCVSPQIKFAQLSQSFEMHEIVVGQTRRLNYLTKPTELTTGRTEMQSINVGVLFQVLQPDAVQSFPDAFLMKTARTREAVICRVVCDINQHRNS